MCVWGSLSKATTALQLCCVCLMCCICWFQLLTLPLGVRLCKPFTQAQVHMYVILLPVLQKLKDTFSHLYSSLYVQIANATLSPPGSYVCVCVYVCDLALVKVQVPLHRTSTTLSLVWTFWAQTATPTIVRADTLLTT